MRYALYASGAIAAVLSLVLDLFMPVPVLLHFFLVVPLAFVLTPAFYPLVEVVLWIRAQFKRESFELEFPVTFFASVTLVIFVLIASIFTASLVVDLLRQQGYELNLGFSQLNYFRVVRDFIPWYVISCLVGTIIGLPIDWYMRRRKRINEAKPQPFELIGQ